MNGKTEPADSHFYRTDYDNYYINYFCREYMGGLFNWE